jgi:FkbM family methyltransferase
MRFLRKALDGIFYIIHPLFKSELLQLFLRKYIALPYSMVEHLNFKGIVPFNVSGKELYMQSYNTPIEITVFWRGIFGGREGAELSLWSKLSEDADVAIDIGANNGIYSLVSSVRPELEIHAFEPVPRVYEMLIENTKLNKNSNIKPHLKVVSNTSENQTLFVPKDGWVDVASLDEEFACKYTEGREMVKIECESVTLNNFFIDNKLNQNKVICKIDVEGAEPLVLSGADQVIRQGKTVFLIEALDKVAFEDVKKYFPSDYSIFGVDVKNRRLFRTMESSDLGNNYLFIKTDYPNLLDGVNL